MNPNAVLSKSEVYTVLITAIHHRKPPSRSMTLTQSQSDLSFTHQLCQRQWFSTPSSCIGHCSLTTFCHLHFLQSIFKFLIPPQNPAPSFWLDAFASYFTQLRPSNNISPSCPFPYKLISGPYFTLPTCLKGRGVPPPCPWAICLLCFCYQLLWRAQELHCINCIFLPLSQYSTHPRAWQHIYLFIHGFTMKLMKLKFHSQPLSPFPSVLPTCCSQSGLPQMLRVAENWNVWVGEGKLDCNWEGFLCKNLP